MIRQWIRRTTLHSTANACSWHLFPGIWGKLACIRGSDQAWSDQRYNGTQISLAIICCSFAQLIDVEQHASSGNPKRDSQYLNTIKQGSRETLKEYIAWFNKEKVSFTNLNAKTVINALKNGLHCGSDLCKELTRYPFKNFEDVLAKAWALD